jgi:LDH2 family malate/lactate/ureidoglycolate dehydrogenase
MNVDAFQKLSEFEGKIEAYVASLKDVPLAQGFDQVFYPGEMETLANQKYRAQGLTLPEDTIQSLIQLSQETGVNF